MGGEGPAFPDLLESALLFLLWQSAEKRLQSAPEAVLPLVSDVKVQGAVAALLNGESPISLQERWHETSDRFLHAALSSGGDFCETFSGAEEAWQKVTASLGRRSTEKEYRSLMEKMTRGVASKDDMNRLNDLARILKGRR